MLGKRGSRADDSQPPTDPARQSILCRIERALDKDPEAAINLDVPTQDGELRWAPGALESLFAPPGDGPRGIGARRLSSALGAAVRKPDSPRVAHFHDLAAQADVPSIVDDFLERSARAGLDRSATAALARRIARESPDPAPVKLAIALLGISGDPDDRPLLLTLGRYEELTEYAAVALQNLLGEAEDELWILVRTTSGWGRIAVIHRLQGTARADIKDWLLREGHRNDIMGEEVAYVCAATGDLIGALRTPTVDDELLDRLGELFQSLVASYRENIGDYESGAEAARLYVERVAASENLSFERFLAVRALRDLVDEPSSPGPAASWPAETRWRIRMGAADYLARPEWLVMVERCLSTEDDRLFWTVCRVGEILGIDVWPVRFERQAAGTSDQWYFLMQTDRPERVEAVLALGRRKLDLAKVGSGPGAGLGFGPDFGDDSATDFIVQDLARFPGLGWDFLRTGLQGRSIRLRNMTVRALEQWGRGAWPAETPRMLRAAIDREPDEEVKARMAALLDGSPLA